MSAAAEPQAAVAAAAAARQRTTKNYRYGNCRYSNEKLHHPTRRCFSGHNSMSALCVQQCIDNYYTPTTTTDTTTRPSKRQTIDKQNIFFKFLFHEIPVHVTQQLIKQSDTLNSTHENKQYTLGFRFHLGCEAFLKII